MKRFLLLVKNELDDNRGVDMSQLNGLRGLGASIQLRKRQTTRVKDGIDASLIGFGRRGEMMVRAHADSAELRQCADRYTRALENPYFEESSVHFTLDSKTGNINVSIFDASRGFWEMKMSPDEVEQGLKSLEETDDNAVPLVNFFVDVTM